VPDRAARRRRPGVHDDAIAGARRTARGAASVLRRRWSGPDPAAGPRQRRRRGQILW